MVTAYNINTLCINGIKGIYLCSHYTMGMNKVTMTTRTHPAQVLGTHVNN